MRLKRESETKLLSVGMTDGELEKMNRLLKHFNKKFMHELVAELIKVVPYLELTKTTSSVKSAGNNFKVRHFRLTQEQYDFIEAYSLDHFREKGNTIRYFINTSYELFIKE